MGEAKRRKKSDPYYGKDSISVRLDPDLVLSSSLLELQQLQQAKNQKTEKGIVRYRDVSYPAVFIPYLQTYRGKTQLYSRVALDPKQIPFSLNQRMTDRISHLACLEIVAKYESLEVFKNERK